MRHRRSRRLATRSYAPFRIGLEAFVGSGRPAAVRLRQRSPSSVRSFPVWAALPGGSVLELLTPRSPQARRARSCQFRSGRRVYTIRRRRTGSPSRGSSIRCERGYRSRRRLTTAGGAHAPPGTGCGFRRRRTRARGLGPAGGFDVEGAPDQARCHPTSAGRGLLQDVCAGPGAARKRSGHSERAGSHDVDASDPASEAFTDVKAGQIGMISPLGIGDAERIGLDPGRSKDAFVTQSAVSGIPNRIETVSTRQERSRRATRPRAEVIRVPNRVSSASSTGH